MTENAIRPTEMSLGDLMNSFWRAKLYIIIGLIVMGALALSFITLATPKYKAQMIVAPADGYALGDYASKIQYDRIASLPFWRPKDQEGASTDFYRFIYTLKGATAATILMKDDSVLSGINRGLDTKIKTAEELSIYL